MRQFFFCFVLFLGLFGIIDAFAFDGQNSADAWQEVQRVGQRFNSVINEQVGPIWRWTACIFAAVLTIAVSALLPAEGAWQGEGWAIDGVADSRDRALPDISKIVVSGIG